MNRKVLSDMAINDAEGFAKLAELAKRSWLNKRKKYAVSFSGETGSGSGFFLILYFFKKMCRDTEKALGASGSRGSLGSIGARW